MRSVEGKERGGFSYESMIAARAFAANERRMGIDGIDGLMLACYVC